MKCIFIAVVSSVILFSCNFLDKAEPDSTSCINFDFADQDGFAVTNPELIESVKNEL